MRRILSQWFIHRSIDLHRPIPPWVQRWIQRDPFLERYQSRLHALETSLMADAPREIDPHATRDESQRVVQLCPSTPTRSWGLASWSGLALAAMMALVLLSVRWLVMSGGPIEKPSIAHLGTPAPEGQVVVGKPAIDPEEIKRAIESGSAIIHSLKSNANAAMALDTPIDSNLWRWPNEPIVAPLVATRTLAMRSLDCFDQGIVAESHHLLHDIRSGANYFVHTLPARLTLLSAGFEGP